ncbi:hypothetical protein [Sphingomonas sp. Leaf412]|uniref:hypothetical protein n=1 Tax=Sphingomonas sp. Leaf412 TaxID=1736370 RepID=UPI000B107D25|nr:hypothetical protein [Sphingomonas sp. Leaf412]
MPSSTDYKRFADTARTEADVATLDNVRDRCLRSEKAWLALAHRSEKSEKGRSGGEPQVPAEHAGEPQAAALFIPA